MLILNASSQFFLITPQAADNSLHLSLSKLTRWLMKCCMEDSKKVQKNHFSYQTAITSTHTHTHNIEQHIVNDINHFGRFIKWVFACNERFTFLPRYASDAIYSHEGINHSKNNIMSSEYQQRATLFFRVDFTIFVLLFHFSRKNFSLTSSSFFCCHIYSLYVPHSATRSLGGKITCKFMYFRNLINMNFYLLPLARWFSSSVPHVSKTSHYESNHRYCVV